MVGTTGPPQMNNINRLHHGAGIFGLLKPKGYFQPCPHPKPKRGTEGPPPWLFLSTRQENQFG
jgi:hypothetical protein